QQVDLQLQGYPPTHPKLVQLQQDIDATKRDLATEAAKLANSGDVVDPLSAMQKYSTDAAALEIDIESSRAQEAALRKTIDGYDQALQRLPEKEFQLARLTRERDVTHKIYSMLLEKLEEARIAEAERLPSCRVIDIAQAPTDPVRPRKKLNLALGLLLGGLVGTGFAFGWETWRGGVESTAEMERRTGWKVLASLPRLDANSHAPIPANDASGRQKARAKRGLMVAREPNSGPAEAFRMLRTALQFEGLGESARTLLVTSVGPADGKSTTISNLALSFAAAGHRVAIVDAEVRRPVQHEIFGMDRSPGLTEWLRSETPTRAVLRPTSLARVDLLSTGQSLDTPGDALVA